MLLRPQRPQQVAPAFRRPVASLANSIAGAEDTQSEFARQHQGWNLAVLLTESCAYNFGMACLDQSTVLPALLARLGASDVAIGFFRLASVLGLALPAVLAADRINGRPNHKRFLLTTTGTARMGLLLLPPGILLLATRQPAALIILILVVLTNFATMEGAGTVSWFDILAKTVPARLRGRFFGAMQSTGGLLAIVSGALVAFTLQHLAYPSNYAVLAACWCVGAGISFAGLTMVREPAGPAAPPDERPSLLEFSRGGIALLRANHRLARLVVARFLLDGAGIALPFYVLFARQDLRMAETTVGGFILAKYLGKVLTGPLWGAISERIGSFAGVRAVATMVVAVPILGLASGWGSPWLIFAAFFLIGAAEDGLWMACSTALLESVSAEERPMAVGIATMLQAPSAIYGPIGGAVAQLAGYPVTICLALATTLCGLAVIPRAPKRSAA